MSLSKQSIALVPTTKWQQTENMQNTKTKTNKLVSKNTQNRKSDTVHL